MQTDFKKYANSFQTVTKPGLERIKALLSQFNNPQDSLRCIHIAGTNGKGSVAAFLQTMLTKAGYKTGKYISPNLINVNERISVNGREISDYELSGLLNEIEAVIPKAEEEAGEIPTQFEIWTAAAFIFFAREKCDYVVLETGLGGRFDATNVIKSNIISIITHIDFDHTEYLGNTLTEIAAEKAGIIKKACPVVTVNRSAEAVDVIKNTAKSLCCDFYEVIRPDKKAYEKIYEIYDDGNIKAKLSLGGVNQLENAALAVKAATILGLKKEDMIFGLENAKNPGRFELTNDNVIYDGAHNPNGISALAENLKRYFKDENFIFIMAAMKDKDINSSLGIIKDLCFSLCCTAVENNERSLSPEKLAEAAINAGINAKSYANISDAFINLPCNKRIVVCGSLYLYKDFKKSIEK